MKIFLTRHSTQQHSFIATLITEWLNLIGDSLTRRPPQVPALSPVVLINLLILDDNPCIILTT